MNAAAYASAIVRQQLVKALADLEKHERDEIFQLVEDYVELDLYGQEPTITAHRDGTVSIVTLADLIEED